jgi:hypothetical protein
VIVGARVRRCEHKPCFQTLKEWLTLWHRIDGKLRQIMSVDVKGMSVEKRAETTEFLKTQAVDYSTGKSTKDAINFEKKKFFKGPVHKKPAAASASSSSASKAKPKTANKIQPKHSEADDGAMAVNGEGAHEDEDKEDEEDEMEDEMEEEEEEEEEEQGESEKEIPEPGLPSAGMPEGPPEGLMGRSFRELRASNATPTVADFFV